MASSLQAAIILAFLLVFTVRIKPVVAANETYYLGFLAPVPTPSADSPIPTRLAQEWQSAFRVAIEVLNLENRTYRLAYVSADSACNWMRVQAVSSLLEQKDIIGVVGPACSAAAISAGNYLNKEIPVVSFAATNEVLSDRSLFPSFFRTVYSDSHQALAVRASMEQLNMTNATILCAKDYYSLHLAESIQAIAAERVSSMIILEPGDNSTIDTIQLQGILNSLQPSNCVILAVPPLVAEDIWRVAASMGKTTYPWWYFGTDGATAFDPFIEDDTSNLVAALQGEIGIAPYGGDNSDNSVCQKFYEYWREKAYPGLPSMGLNKSRSYVPNVIDTVMMFFEIVDALTKNNIPVNASAVLAALKGKGPGTPNFNGCTGNVQIDPDTGSRKISSNQPAMYDLVSLVQNSWELKGRIENETFLTLQPLMRPTSITERTTAPDGSKRRNGGIIAGLVLFSVAFVLLLVIVAMYYKNRQSRSRSFVRIIH